MSFLYEGWREESPQFAAFLDEQFEHQKRWRSALKVMKKEAEAAYALFQWCDRMSLILCRHELPKAERALEVRVGPDGTRYDVICRDDILTVQPWPFEGSHFTVSFEARQLTQLSFKDDSELRATLQETSVIDLIWKFEK